MQKRWPNFWRYPRKYPPLYARWYNIIARCYRKTCPSYKNYGARGVTVDARWRGYPEGFNAFVADMGMPPPGMTLDRIDNNGPYSPANCRWTSRRTQLRNNRRTSWITVGDVSMCLADWAQRLSLHISSPRSTKALPITLEGRYHNPSYVESIRKD